MSGTRGLPTDPAERDALAGEYVLGTLDAATAATIAAAIPADPAWRQAVEAWERRLQPLGALAPPAAPPPDIWDRIEARIAPRRYPVTRRRLQLDWLWRFWAIGATALAGYLVFLLPSRTPPVRVMTVLISDRNSPALLAQVDRQGWLQLNAIPAATGRQLQSPSGRSLQVWALPVGATVPVSLGVLPHEPGRVTSMPNTPVRPSPGMLIEISVEPEGGSTTGRPSGPVVYFGRLSEAGPDT